MLGSKLKTADGVMTAIRKLSRDEFLKLDDLIDGYEDELEVAEEAARAESDEQAAEESAEAAEVDEVAEQEEIVEDSTDDDETGEAVQRTSESYDTEIVELKKQLAEVQAKLDIASRKQWKADDAERTALDRAAAIFN